MFYTGSLLSWASISARETTMKSVCVAVIVALFAACAWSSLMAGGFRDVDLPDERVSNALNVAVSRHNKRENDMFRREAVEVLKAQSQVVAGMKYIIIANMTRTNCNKNRDTEGCGPTAEHYLCTFTVWSRPWLPDIKVLDEKCSGNDSSL